MELIGQLVGKILCYLAMRPIVFICQAVSGLLLVEVGPNNKRSRYAAVAMLVVGCILLGISWIVSSHSFCGCLVLYASGFGLLAAASTIGYRMEQEALKSNGPL